MPLSRHFYSLDEVQAALFYTSSRGDTSEALFWCQELLLSGYIGEAISTLFQAWLWNVGQMSIQWLITSWNTLAADELHEEDILLAAYSLASLHHKYRDSSIWNILVLTQIDPNKMPDRITRKIPNMLPSHDEKEIYLICSIYQGKARCAWWISRYISNNRVWELISWYIENMINTYKSEYNICLEALKNYEKLLGYKTYEYDIITQCMSILILCIKPSRQEENLKPLASLDENSKKLLKKMKELEGTRSGRMYSIPNCCLYGTTIRGNSTWSQNNFQELYNIEKYLVGCPYWDEKIMEYGNIQENGQIKWNSDETMEQFYERYFPDDIPDEWPKVDLIKSHGEGILGPNEVTTISKFSRISLSKYTRLAWNTSKDINSYLNTLCLYDCQLDKVIKESNTLMLSNENLKKLAPVIKIKSI